MHGRLLALFSLYHCHHPHCPREGLVPSEPLARPPSLLYCMRSARERKPSMWLRLSCTCKCKCGNGDLNFPPNQAWLRVMQPEAQDLVEKTMKGTCSFASIKRLSYSNSTHLNFNTKPCEVQLRCRLRCSKLRVLAMLWQ